MGELVIHTGLKLNGSIASGSGEPLLARNSTTSILQTQLDTGGNPFMDNETLIRNSSDPTKLAKFSAASLSTGTTRTYTLPNSDGTLLLSTEAWKTSGTTTLTGHNSIQGSFNILFGSSLSPIPSFTAWGSSVSLNTPSVAFFDINNFGGSGGNVTLNDQRATKRGIEYAADYSSTFTSRSLVDKAYVDSVAGSGGWATSGTTLTTGNLTISAGGLGTEVLSFDGDFFDTFPFSAITMAPSNQFAINVSGRAITVLPGTGITFGVNFPSSEIVGYSADYSSQYTDRSFVDKGFTNSNYIKKEGTSTSALFSVSQSSGSNTSLYFDPTFASGSISLVSGVDRVNSAGEVRVSNQSRASLISRNTATGESGSIRVDMSSYIGMQDSRTVTRGFEYQGDYSAGFTDRSLADWGNVWKVKGNTTITEPVTITSDENGGIELIMNDGMFDTRSSLILNAFSNEARLQTIGNVSGSQSVSNLSTTVDGIFMQVYEAGPILRTQLEIYSNSVKFTDSRTVKKGIEYAADYSSDFTSRSLVDKGYVDSVAGTSGEFIPTSTNITNVDSSTPQEGQYIKVGNVVTVSGFVTIDPTAGGSATTEIALTLPVAATFTVSNQCAGIFTSTMASVSGTVVGLVSGGTTGSSQNKALFQFKSPQTGAIGFYYTYTYRLTDS